MPLLRREEPGREAPQRRGAPSQPAQRPAERAGEARGRAEAQPTPEHLAQQRRLHQQVNGGGGG